MQKLTTLQLIDWDTEEDEENWEPKKRRYERIYGIKFFRTTKPQKDLSPNDDIYYIICATRTKLYQFKGPGQQTFLQLFKRFEKQPMLFNDSCKYFPPCIKNSKKFTGSDLNVLYKNDERIEQFGWKTETGFCFGYFNFYDHLPKELNNFIVVPFEKINQKGKKEKELEPLSITHTQNHIFMLYEDCVTIISKLTSNIIHSLYLKSQYTGILYNEFAQKTVLAFKFGDRTDLTKIFAKWMLAASFDILKDGVDLIVPVPLSYLRLLKRRYNQSALLAKELSLLTGIEKNFSSELPYELIKN